MTKRAHVYHSKTSPKSIQLTMMLYIWFPLSLCNFEGLLRERDIEICPMAFWYWSGIPVGRCIV